MTPAELPQHMIIPKATEQPSHASNRLSMLKKYGVLPGDSVGQNLGWRAKVWQKEGGGPHCKARPGWMYLNGGYRLRLLRPGFVLPGVNFNDNWKFLLQGSAVVQIRTQGGTLLGRIGRRSDGPGYPADCPDGVLACVAGRYFFQNVSLDTALCRRT